MLKDTTQCNRVCSFCAKNHLISGNEFLSRISTQGLYELKVELEDFEGNTRYARYTTFEVGDRTSNFRLTVDGYSGDAGTNTKLTLKGLSKIAIEDMFTFSCFFINQLRTVEKLVFSY